MAEITAQDYEWIKNLQDKIENLYQVSCDASVDHHLIEPHQIHYYLKQHPWLAYSDEAMLLEQEEDEIHIGLHLNINLLKKYSQISFDELNPEQATEVAPVLEGVSHFVYCCWKFQQGLSITQLEMEVQAEIDKYILFSLDKDLSFRKELALRLFHQAKLSPYLSAEQKNRYETAIHFAIRFCHTLDKTQHMQSHNYSFLQKVRDFYRKNQNGKMQVL